MATGDRRGVDWFSVAVLFATFVVIAGGVTLGTAVFAVSGTPTPQPTVSSRLVFKVPTRAPTPTRFPSPTPAPTSTSAPTPTALSTSVPTSTPTEIPIEEPPDEVIKETARSVVQVRTSSASGTAFRVVGGAVPQFVTSSRAVGKATSVTLYAPDGSKHTGTVARRETAVDLAVITAGDLGAIPSLILADDEPTIGDHLFVVGYRPPGKTFAPPLVTQGTVTGWRAVGELEYLQTDAPMGQGAAGGPVVSASGRVLGIAVLGLRDQGGTPIQGASFAVPAGILQAFLKGTG